MSDAELYDFEQGIIEAGVRENFVESQVLNVANLK